MNTTAWRGSEGARGKSRHALRSLVLAAALLTLPIAGCGDDGDEPSTGGSASPSGSTTPPGGRASQKSEDFIVACLDESANECTEYLGEEAKRSGIEEAVREMCRLGGNTMQSTRCSTEGVVGACRHGVIIDEVRTPFDTFSYAPLTVDRAKLRCTSGTFTAK